MRRRIEIREFRTRIALVLTSIEERPDSSERGKAQASSLSHGGRAPSVSPGARKRWLRRSGSSEEMSWMIHIVPLNCLVAAAPATADPTFRACR